MIGLSFSYKLHCLDLILVDPNYSYALSKIVAKWHDFKEKAQGYIYIAFGLVNIEGF